MKADKFNRPKTDKEASELLKSLLAGKKTIDELIPDNNMYQVTMNLTGDGKPRELGTDAEELAILRAKRRGEYFDITLNLQ